MIKEKIKVNSHTYSVTLNEQTQMYATRLRTLYQQSYSDMDSFDDIIQVWLSANVTALPKTADIIKTIKML